MTSSETVGRYLKRGVERLLSPVMRLHTFVSTSRLPRQQEKISELRRGDGWCLIVLDACRYDVFAEVHDEYLRGSLEPVRSAGYDTFDYVRLNWPDTYEDVTYVTAAAPITAKQFDFESGDERADGLLMVGDELAEKYRGYVPNDHLSDIVEVWRDSWDEVLGVCPPEPVTERVVDLAPEKVVAHYFQPHAPYIGSEKSLSSMDPYDVDVTGGAVDAEVWQRVRDGTIDDSELRTLYTENLRRALQSVCELVSRTDYDRYVVVGDHGEALGEYGRYAHPPLEHPYIRKVPWFEVEGVREDHPVVEYERGDATPESRSVEERLQQLGYLDG
jgi:hypothetical protein